MPGRRALTPERVVLPMWHTRLAALVTAVALLAGCGPGVQDPAPVRSPAAEPATPPSQPAPQPASQPAPQPEPSPEPAHTVKKPDPEKPLLVFRRGESPVPLAREITMPGERRLAVTISQAASGLSLVATMDGEEIHRFTEGQERLEEVYVSQMVAGPGELVVTTRKDCRELRFQLLSRPWQGDGRWRVLIDHPGIDYGYLRLDFNRFTGVQPPAKPKDLSHLIFFNYLDHMGGWNDNTSTYVEGTAPPPPIPDCPARP